MVLTMDFQLIQNIAHGNNKHIEFENDHGPIHAHIVHRLIESTSWRMHASVVIVSNIGRCE